MDNGFVGTEEEWLAQLNGALVYRGSVPDQDSLPADAVLGDIYSIGTTYWAYGPDGWNEMGQVGEVDLSDYLKKDISLLQDIEPFDPGDVLLINRGGTEYKFTTEQLDEHIIDVVKKKLGSLNPPVVLSLSFRNEPDKNIVSPGERVDLVIKGVPNTGFPGYTYTLILENESGEEFYSKTNHEEPWIPTPDNPSGKPDYDEPTSADFVVTIPEDYADSRVHAKAFITDSWGTQSAIHEEDWDVYIPPDILPWEDEEFANNRFHIIQYSGDTTEAWAFTPWQKDKLSDGAYRAWFMDGQEVTPGTDSIAEGVEFVIATGGGDATRMFSGMDINWGFGREITSTSEIVKADFMFENSTGFNSDIGWWDMSKVQLFGNMFKGASSFLQDLSWWCTPNAVDTLDVFGDCPMKDNPELQPQWGACPTPPPWQFHVGGVVHITNRSRWWRVNELNAPGFVAAYLMDGTELRSGERVENYDEFVSLFTHDCTQAFRAAGGGFQLGDQTRLDDVTIMDQMFDQTMLNQDISWLNTTNVQSMEKCFHQCENFDQDLSGMCWRHCATPSEDWCAGSPLADQPEKWPKWGKPC